MILLLVLSEAYHRDESLNCNALPNFLYFRQYPKKMDNMYIIPNLFPYKAWRFANCTKLRSYNLHHNTAFT